MGRTTITSAEPDLRVAACALLLEIAYADADFSHEERHHVESTIRAEFGLGPVEAAKLVRSAERARDEAPGAWHFTNAIVERYSAGQKAVLADIMHALLHVDGKPTWREDYVVRKISALLRLEPEYV